MNTLKNILGGGRGLNRIFLFFILVATTSLYYTSCNDVSLISLADDLQAAKEKWESSNIDDYQVEIERQCYCPAPFRYIMTVENGEIVKILDSDNGCEVESLTGYYTIDELFTWLERTIGQDPKKLKLRFHHELGYPTFIDYNLSDNIVDEELLMKLRNLQTE